MPLVIVCSLLLSACVGHNPQPIAPTAIAWSMTHTQVPGFEEAPTYTPETAPPVSATPEPPQLAKPDDLWRQMRDNMHLPRHLKQKRVLQELRWMQRHPQYLARLGPRLQRYLPYIYHQVRQQNIPAEIALLPIVESALDVYAFSHGGAAGPWQFLRGTAKQYGISINDWYDGRRDIIASTDAALAYLTYLHNRFDSWELALAGYNAGQGNVSRALRKNPNAGFFELALPKETRHYVPRLLALAEVVAHPEKYGISLPEVSNQPQFNTLSLPGQFQIDKLAQTAGVPLDTVYEFNPALNQWATPPQGPHRIILPVELELSDAQVAVNTVAASQRMDWLEVTVRPGDTLSHIARRHNTDITTIKTANQLRGHNIRAGKKLMIPTNPNPMDQPLFAQARSGAQAKRHEVKSGESMWAIARQHGVSLTRLMKANHIGPRDTLAVGKTLLIPGSRNTASRDEITRKVRYKVRRGDSLARIASKFNVSVSQLVQWNKLDVKRYLQPGQGLLVYVSVVGG